MYFTGIPNLTTVTKIAKLQTICCAALHTLFNPLFLVNSHIFCNISRNCLSLCTHSVYCLVNYPHLQNQLMCIFSAFHSYLLLISVCCCQNHVIDLWSNRINYLYDHVIFCFLLKPFIFYKWSPMSIGQSSISLASQTFKF